MSSGFQPEVLWREGMFLCPQHMQSFARFVGSRIRASESIGSAGSWGLVHAEFDEDALQRDLFAVRAAEVVFPDGQRAVFPGNARVAQREFGALFTDVTLDVHLGIPARTKGVPELGEESAERARFHGEIVEGFDENLNTEPCEIEIKVLHARLFFGEEDRSGFECVPLARLVREGRPVATSVLCRDFIPPCLELRGAPVLMRRLREVADAVRSQARDLAARIPDTTGLSSVEKGADLAGFVKLQAVNQCVVTLEQLAGLGGIHPFHAYQMLVQAVGSLAIFGEQRVAPQLAVYEHGDLDACFREVLETVQSLIPAEVSVPYDTLEFREEDPARPGLFSLEIPDDWLEANPLVFLGVELAEPAEKVATLVKTGVKLVAESDLERVLQGVVPGVELEHVRTPPLAFPKRSDLHYFRLDMEGESRARWKQIEQSRKAVLLTALRAMGAWFHLYVELRGARG